MTSTFGKKSRICPDLIGKCSLCPKCQHAFIHVLDHILGDLVEMTDLCHIYGLAKELLFKYNSILFSLGKVMDTCL